jgi:hypothetical protein
MDLREITWDRVDWMHMAQEDGQVAGSYEHDNEPSRPIKGKEFLERIVLLDFIHRLVSQKIEELKIWTKYHNTQVYKIHTRVNY